MKQLYTKWGKELDLDQVLPEYPRPMMKRESYINLNGYWEYKITNKKQTKLPKGYDGKILVPFSPESVLSGVKRQLLPEQELWYRRQFEIDRNKNRRILLHFGAVDQMCIVYINGKTVKIHKGGYLPFTVDITNHLCEGENELCVRVRDLSDFSYHARGKQKLKRGGMFYTAQSGIWQTVWMEEVPYYYIDSIKCTPLYDESKVEITVFSKIDQIVRIFLEEQEYKGKTNHPIRIFIKEKKSWTPEHPFLYKYEVEMGEDKIESYFAMRCVTVEKDKKGIPRICLNHKKIFQKGILDQGYWPDGLYTAPSDEAMIFDIAGVKANGYNMIRKHCKIEPQRWYYHCDKMGVLVWQDVVNGGSSYHHWFVTYCATLLWLLHIPVKDRFRILLSRRSEAGRIEFEKEMYRTVKTLYSHPSVIVWTLFNEGWGQFDAIRLGKILKRLDKTRLLDAASGWFDQGNGDLKSIHNYFFKQKVKPEKSRAAVLSEFGGFSMKIKNHSSTVGMYGYRMFTNRKKLSRAYDKIWKEVKKLEEKGLCAAVYTQLTDVEEEVNGLWTYDREILKIKN
nr:sugar-binding domain-containing protein [uncultured Sellimonas sp.]